MGKIMKLLTTTLLSLLFAAIIGITIFDRSTEETSTFTFAKSVKYVDSVNNIVAYYAIIGTNGEIFQIDKEDIHLWKDKRLHRGWVYQVTTNGYFSPKIKRLKLVKVG